MWWSHWQIPEGETRAVLQPADSRCPGPRHPQVRGWGSGGLAMLNRNLWGAQPPVSFLSRSFLQLWMGKGQGGFTWAGLVMPALDTQGSSGAAQGGSGLPGVEVEAGFSPALF